MKTKGQRNQDQKFLDLWQQALREKNFTVERRDDTLIVSGHGIKAFVTSPNYARKEYAQSFRFRLKHQRKPKIATIARYKMSIANHPSEQDWNRIFKSITFAVRKHLKKAI